MEITKEEYLAWAAGIFEGEGSTNRYNPITVAQKDPWILYKLKELYGGSITYYNDKNIFVWYLGSEEGRNLLRSMIPYLSPRRLQQIENNNVLKTLYEMKTHCKNGHEFIESNTVFASNGARQCRICINSWHREHRKKLKLVRDAS
jgi:hypothetical protein